MKNPELGSSSVLNQWENGGKTLTKWELCRVVKELRKYKKHDRALEVRNQKVIFFVCFSMIWVCDGLMGFILLCV